MNVFVQVTGKSKVQVSKWMQELASDKPLSQLGKKVFLMLLKNALDKSSLDKFTLS